ncbi:hypothetical protein DSO57_1022063 [Entomophthora muscae]|uniref:Uncharacterized protein n=1 Tax=Entomophthora muscae TaxID=34485 RepID=A0ACC2RUB3_9FUNG|nr:hypothetical protein DSO57_1022063 [Entomophthora muscae]
MLSYSGPPKVPCKLPFLDHTQQLHTRASEFLQECRKVYGGIFILYYLGERVIVFSGIEAKEMLKMTGLLVKKPRNRVMFISDAIGEWSIDPQHNLDAAAVTRKNITPLLKGVLPDVLDQITKEFGTRLKEMPAMVDSYSFISEIVISSVAILLVGHTLAQNAQLRHIMKTYSDEIEALITKGLQWKTIPFVGNKLAHKLVRSQTPSVKVRKNIRDIINSTYIDRTAMANPPAATNVLESLVDEGHTIEAIAHSLMGLIFASVSTTTNTCLFLINDLLAFPNFIARLKAEQIEYPLDLTKEYLDQMVYLNSAIRETLRHRGHRLEQWRITTHDHVTQAGITIPKQSLLALDVSSLHFNEDVYPSPLEYNPFRFVGSRQSATHIDASYIGFGSGLHACPGRFFAVQEVTAIMATLLRGYDFAPEDGMPIPFTSNTCFPQRYRLVITPSPASVSHPRKIY